MEEDWVEEGYSVEHTRDSILVFRRAIDPNEKIRLTTALDDICRLCHRKGEKDCKLLDPYDTAKYDNKVLDFYGLCKGLFCASTIHEFLRRKGKYEPSV